MKHITKKRNLRIGVSLVIIAIAFANYIQVNGDSQAPKLRVVKDANADVNCTSSNDNCYINTTEDGKAHYLTNAENS